ncbi:hypothetical protein [Aeromonas caviae]|uniref:hypothetical protein n=1 Tax=Aeromonas caviae TaxID=648 RepID=UPI0015DD48F9|nr:hypothetical protein [Aeromonas caviae]MDX7808718.1 hypothetical protein [Aeromonas caviae]BBS17593.1 hypothetical protein WP5W18E02_26300 [Aeromonas caviae]
MRLDTRIDRDSLEKQQLFFIECWSSLCSQKSIDSDRVTYNNILNATEELLDLYAQGDKFRAVEKRRHIIQELLDLLSLDKCLHHSVFNNIPRQLMSLCGKANLSDLNANPIEKKKALVISLLNQLSKLIRDNYRRVVVEHLQALLLSGPKDDQNVYKDIYYATNSLISVLVTSGMPTSECFILGKHYLFSREKSFAESFGDLCDKVICEEFPVKIQLKIISEKLYVLIDEAGGLIKFRNCSFSLINGDVKNSVAVLVDVTAISISAAKKKADADLHRSLDVIAYMMGRSDIQVVKTYTAIKNSGEEKTLMDLDKPPVNALDRLSRNEFDLYMTTISRLHNQATDLVVRKVSAAFRFFKNGLSEDTPESRFTAYWSALESLTVDVSEQSLSHDAHVILAVLPCIGLDYPVKQLFALRSVANLLKWQPIDLNGDAVNILEEDIGALYSSLKNPIFATEVLSRLENYPYAKYRFGAFIELCQNPYNLAVKIQEHKDKVELQLHRLYRTRNAIVHNASTPDRLDMLIINLEHYLRSTLNAMVYMMNSAQSISSPEEAFNRYHYQSECILMEMDPSLALKESKRAEERKKLESGQSRANDSSLIQWLSMHT